MADDSYLSPGPMDPGASTIDPVSGTQTGVMPDNSIIMRGAVPHPAGAFPSPALPPWMPSQQQIEAQKAQQQQEIDSQRLQSSLTGLPYDQAQKAYQAGMKIIAQRGYQSDLASGKPAHEALAKWAPMLFADRPQTFTGAVRQSFTPPKPAARFIPGNEATGQPGFIESGVGTVHLLPPKKEQAKPQFVPANEQTGEGAHWITGSGNIVQPHVAAAAKTGVLTPLEANHLKFAEHEFDKLSKAQEEDTDGRTAFNKSGEELTPGQATAVRAYTKRAIDINAAERTIKGYHDRIKAAMTAPVAQPPRLGAPAAPASMVAPPAAQAPRAPIPLPSRQADLIVGQPYVTKKGVYTWTGQKLRKVE
jgi:hypothetical protein